MMDTECIGNLTEEKIDFQNHGVKEVKDDVGSEYGEDLERPPKNEADDTHAAFVRPEDLSEHPLHASIYEDSGDDLVESIASLGIQVPLLVTHERRIIDGHRRWDAAKKIGLDKIPIFLSPIVDELEIEEAYIHANLHRIKTLEQKIREYIKLKEIETRKAEKRQKAALKQGSEASSVPPNLAEREKGDARDIAAHKLGLAHSTAENGAKLVDLIDSFIREGKTQEAQELKDRFKKSVNGAIKLASERGWIPGRKNIKELVAPYIMEIRENLGITELEILENLGTTESEQQDVGYWKTRCQRLESENLRLKSEIEKLKRGETSDVSDKSNMVWNPLPIPPKPAFLGGNTHP